MTFFEGSKSRYLYIYVYILCAGERGGEREREREGGRERERASERELNANVFYDLPSHIFPNILIACHGFL